MGSLRLERHNLSTLTNECIDFQEKFLVEASQDSSLKGRVKTNLVGRVIALGVSLILHAEAVCRAVYVCFLTIHEIFSQTDQQLLQALKKEKISCSQAYDASLKSLLGFLNPKLLEAQSIDKPAPLRIEPAPLNEEHYREPGPDAHYEQVETPREELPEMIEIDSVLSLSSDSPFDSPILVATKHNKIPEFRLEPDRPPSPPRSPISQAQREIDLLTSEASFRPSVPLLPDELHRKQIREQNIQKRKNALIEDYKHLTDREAAEAILHNCAEAQRQVSLNQRPLTYLKGPEEHYQDPKWTRVCTQVDNYEIGFCQFAVDERGLKTEFVAEKFNLQVDRKEYPVQVFGLLDPILGMRASLYIKENLSQELHRQLQQHAHAVTHSNLAMGGIWNAINQTFMKLNIDFQAKNKNIKLFPDETAADHGSSAAIAIMLDGMLWVAHVGSLGIILNQANNGYASQLNENTDPKNEKHQTRIENGGGSVTPNGRIYGDRSTWSTATAIGLHYLGGAVSSKPCIVRKSLNANASDSYLFMGTRTFFETTNSKEIGRLLHENRREEAVDLAHDIIHSTRQAKAEQKEFQAQTQPLACLLVKIASSGPLPKPSMSQPELAPRQPTPLSPISEEWERLSDG